MRGRRARGHRRKGAGRDSGAAPSGPRFDPGHHSGGFGQGVPVPPPTPEKGPAAPKGPAPTGRRKPSQGPPRKAGAGPEEAKARRPTHGFTPPPIPDHVAAAETVMSDVIPTGRRRKTATGDRAPSKPPKKPAPTPELDDVMSAETVLDAGDRKASKKTGTRRTAAPGAKALPATRRTESPRRPTSPFPSLEDTPLPGFEDEDDDILEPAEEAHPLGGMFIPGLIMEFRGSGGGLLALHLLRSLCAAAGPAFLLAGLAGLAVSGTLPADAAARIPSDLVAGVNEARASLPQGGVGLVRFWPLFLGLGGVVLAAALVLSRAIALYRWNHTAVNDRMLSVQAGLPARLVNVFGQVLLFLLTLGLATPWILAWRKRFLVRHCVVQARRREKPLDFTGTGGQVFVFLLLAGLSAPLIPLTLGVWAVYLDHRRIRWEQDRLKIPSPTGRGMMSVLFRGTFPALLGRSLLWGLLCALTLGLYLPWAQASRWRWIAASSDLVEPPEEEAREKSRGGTRRTERA